MKYTRMKLLPCLSSLVGVLALSAVQAYGQSGSFKAETERDDPNNKIYSFALDKHANTEAVFPVASITAKHRSRKLPSTDAKKDSVKKPSLVVLHPSIVRMIEESPKREVEVVITLDEDIEFPLFPGFERGVSRESAIGKRTLLKRRALMDEIKQLRKNNHRRFMHSFERLGGKLDIKHSFTMANAVAAKLVAEDAKILAEMTNVLAVQPASKKLKPLDDGNPDNNMAVARMPMHLNSDLFQFSPNVPQGFSHFIGIIDTGIYSQHSLFDEQFAETIYAWDCVNGDDGCGDNLSAAWDPEDCVSDGGHGTGVAAIIQGNNSLGFQHQGATGFGIDSFKASSGCTAHVDVGLAVADIDRALENAVAYGDEVINMSIGINVSIPDGITAEQDVTALGADNAYNAGAVVVAASGNDVVLDCPGCAHKALTVGAYDVETVFDLMSYSGHGPATDGRIKPDVIAPTCAETASNDGPNALEPLCGTSGAAPMASAAAMLTRSALQQNVPSVDINEAGYVYAAMHMFARNMGSIDDDTGSGPVNMRGCGRFWFGKTDINSSGDTVSIPMTLTPPYGTGSMKAAIWWPESASQDHNDIDLALISPSGNTVDESDEAESVFERVKGSGFAATSGTWRLEITGFDIQDGPQEVYFAASAGGCIQDFEQAP